MDVDTFLLIKGLFAVSVNFFAWNRGWYDWFLPNRLKRFPNNKKK